MPRRSLSKGGPYTTFMIVNHMPGEHNLNVLLCSMEPVLHRDTFVFCTLPIEEDIPEKVKPQALFKEKEGTTLILREDEALLAGLDYTFRSRMITLNVHSALDAIGFIAVIATSLAKNEISVNPVSAFFHDHLFVPEDKAEKAMQILLDLSKNLSRVPMSTFQMMPRATP